MAKNPNRIHKDSLTRNEKFASMIADGLGSPWTIYIFALLALISLPAVLSSHDLTLIISWITQTFIQLVALSVLQAKAVIDGRHAQILAEETHKNAQLAEQSAEEVLEMLEEIIDSHVELKTMMGENSMKKKK